MKYLLSILLILFLPNSRSTAQFSVQYQKLYSTHNDWFTGIGIAQHKNINQRFSVGVGIEYSHAPLHNDNGWVLTNLNFVPVFVDLKYQCQENKQLHPYIHLSQGISIISYFRKDNSIQTPYKIKEAGYYASGGMGVIIMLNSFISVDVETGIKSFHISGNDLEVNPHGVAGSIGIIFFQKRKK